MPGMSGRRAKIKDVRTDGGKLTFRLSDGRAVSAPLSWFPSLQAASPAERDVWQLIGPGHGVHWPALDYDLSLEGMLEGCREHPNALRYARKALAKFRAKPKGRRLARQQLAAS